MAPMKKVLGKGTAPSQAPASASYSSSDSESFSSDDEQPKKLPISTTAGTPATAKMKTYPRKPAAASSSSDVSTDDTSDGDSDNDNDSDDTPHPSRPSISEQKAPPSRSSISEQKAHPSGPCISDQKVPPSAAANPVTSESLGGPNGGASTFRKHPFKRLWSEKDEITILNELTVFQKNHGHEPNHQEIGTFYHLVKNKIEIEFNKKQLRDKLRKMKIRCKAMISKKEKDGAEKVFNKPHDQAFLYLGRQLWADKLKYNEDDANVDGEVKGKMRLRSASSKRQRNMTTSPVLPVEMVKAVDNSNISLNNIIDQIESVGKSTSSFYKIALGMLKPKKLEVLEGKKKKLCVAEMKTYGIRLEYLEDVLLVLKEELKS